MTVNVRQFVVANSDTIARLLYVPPLGYIMVVMRRQEWLPFKCYRCFVTYMPCISIRPSSSMNDQTAPCA